MLLFKLICFKAPIVFQISIFKNRSKISKFEHLKYKKVLFLPNGCHDQNAQVKFNEEWQSFSNTQKIPHFF